MKSNEDRFTTPVALIIYNRPEETAKVFEAIRRVRPTQLFVIADGPRREEPREISKAAAARAVIEGIDWDCRVTKNFSEVNLGVGERVSSGIDWVFSQAEEAIFLEDDCLPDSSFFPFCAELLKRYRMDARVMMISGTNNLVRWKEDKQDYHFSNYGSIWGWASWRRAWQHYDFRQRSLHSAEARANVSGMLRDPEQFERLVEMSEQIQNKECDTWDFQWDWARLAQKGLAAVSAVNLVSNIGFGKNATHTKHYNLSTANLPRFSASVSPQRSPPAVAADVDYDRKLFLRMKERPDLDSMIAQGIELLNKKRNIHALIFFKEACQARPDEPKLIYYKGLALSRLGQTEKARETLNQLLTLMPDHTEARLLHCQLSERR